MNKQALLTALLLAVASVRSHATVYVLSGTIDPIQATTNPGNEGNGSGNITGTYDDLANLLNYSIDWANLSSAVTNMHFHLGAPGVPGGVQLGIPGPWTSPEIGTDVLLGASQETNLLAGNWYVNVHTVNFGGGEIRGQVDVAPIPESSTSMAMVGASGLFLFRRRRRRNPIARSGPQGIRPFH